MESEFPYLKIKAAIRKIIGAPDDDTRIFRQSGLETEFQAWLLWLNDELDGNLIPATWVPDYVGISRAAVHKRLKAGRLTMFVFELEALEMNLLLQLVTRRKGDFAYCVRSECQAWYDEIQFRKARRQPPELLD